MGNLPNVKRMMEMEEKGVNWMLMVVSDWKAVGRKFNEIKW